MSTCLRVGIESSVKTIRASSTNIGNWESWSRFVHYGARSLPWLMLGQVNTGQQSSVSYMNLMNALNGHESWRRSRQDGIGIEHHWASTFQLWSLAKGEFNPNAALGSHIAWQSQNGGTLSKQLFCQDNFVLVQQNYYNTMLTSNRYANKWFPGMWTRWNLKLNASSPALQSIRWRYMAAILLSAT